MYNSIQIKLIHKRAIDLLLEEEIIFSFIPHRKRKEKDNTGDIGRMILLRLERYIRSALQIGKAKIRWQDALLIVTRPWFTKPVGTSPVWPVTGQTGPARFWFGSVSNRFKFKFDLKKWKIPKKILKILQVATNVMVSKFLKYSLI